MEHQNSGRWPKLPPDISVAKEFSLLGVDAPKGLLRPCIVSSFAPDPLGIQCDKYVLVEFRTSDTSKGMESDLVVTLKALESRLGLLKKKEGIVKIDAMTLLRTEFEGKNTEVQGMAVAIENTSGQFWSIACYSKKGKSEAGFCEDAIAVAARAGGLRFVGAQEGKKAFGHGRIAIPAECVAMGSLGVQCPGATLSWSATNGSTAVALREESLEALQVMAKEKNVVLVEKEVVCKLWEKKAECLLVHLIDTTEKGALDILFLVGGGQERLLVCKYSQPLGLLPALCAQAIYLDKGKVAP